MEDVKISSKTAILLKEKGFAIPQDKGYYKHGTDEDYVELLLWNESETHNDNKDKIADAPTQVTVEKWLRDNYKLHIVVNVGLPHRSKMIGFYSNVIKFNKHHKNKFRSKYYNSCEEANEEAIYQALKLVP